MGERCTVEYERAGGREPGDRIVKCHLNAGHDGPHEEDETGVTWTRVELRRRTPDEMLAYWSGKHLEWIAERNALTARAERAELLVRSVDLFGTAFLWKRPDGTEHVLDPAEVVVVIAADQQTALERAEAAIAAVRAQAERWAGYVMDASFAEAGRLLLAALDSTETPERAK